MTDKNQKVNCNKKVYHFCTLGGRVQRGILADNHLVCSVLRDRSIFELLAPRAVGITLVGKEGEERKEQNQMREIGHIWTLRWGFKAGNLCFWDEWPTALSVHIYIFGIKGSKLAFLPQSEATPICHICTSVYQKFWRTASQHIFLNKNKATHKNTVWSGHFGSGQFFPFAGQTTIY